MSQSKGLSAILVAGNLGNDLGSYITCSKEAVWLLDQCLTDNSTILKHIFQVDQITVMLSLGKIICIVEMDNAFLMGSYNFLREKYTAGKILAHLTCHIITLSRVDHRVFIGIFLVYLFINIVKK